MKERKNTTYILLSTLFMLFLVTHSEDVQLTNPTRTENVKNFCTESREKLIKEQQDSDTTSYQQQTKAALGTDGNTLMIKLFKGENIQGEIDTVRGNIAVYFGFFAIPLVIMILMFPFLMCCCICPDSCPCCQGCRQAPGQPYTEKERTIPAVIVLVLLVLVVGLLIACLIFRAPVSHIFDDTQCSIAITFDDLLNGNISVQDPNSFFTGTVTTEEALRNITDKLDDAKQVLNPISSTGTQIKQKDTTLQGILDDTVKIPKADGSKLQLAYNTPFIATTPTATLNSIFPDELGVSTEVDSLVGKTFVAVQATKQAIKVISELADGLIKVIQSFQKQSSSLIQNVGQINSDLKSYDSSFTQIEKDSRGIRQALYIVFYLLISLGIFAGVLMIIGVSSVLCCQKFPCRYLAYMACGLLYLAGIIYFLMAIVFSLTTPASYWSCQFFQVGLESPQSFKANFEPILGKQTAQTLSPCTNTGDGKIVENLIGSETFDFITSTLNILKQLQSFSSSALKTAMVNQATILATRTDDYLNARILDFESETQKASLEKISKATQYSSCTATGFSEDSWIPSLSQEDPPYVTCKIQNGNQADKDKCPTPSVRSADCSGCLDTFSIFQGQTNLQVQAALTTRYPGPDCASFSEQLSNIWQNFYFIKNQQIGPVSSRAKNVETDIKNVNFDSIDEKFQSAFKTLNDNFNRILSPQTGLIAGLNCKVLSEDIKLVIGTVCDNILIFSFVMRILLAIVAWAIMILSCVTICFGVRAYRSSLSNRKYVSAPSSAYPTSTPFY